MIKLRKISKKFGVNTLDHLAFYLVRNREYIHFLNYIIKSRNKVWVKCQVEYLKLVQEIKLDKIQILYTGEELMKKI
jgi:hypothetical protein